MLLINNTFHILCYNTLIKESPTAVGFMIPSRLEHNFGMNWWGTTNTKISASLAASAASGTAT